MRASPVVLALISLFAAPALRAQTCTPALNLVEVQGGAAPITDVRNARTPRLFLLEQTGRVLISDGGVTSPTPFLDITSLVTSGGERGLLSIAFHPAYPMTPWFFVLYTSQATGGANLGDVRIVRYSVSANPNAADPMSARVLLTIPHPVSNHNGGQLQFGPNDGFLYVSVGDGGGGCDNQGCNSQNTNVLLGKLLRIDVNASSGLAPFYGIPPSNPFVMGGGAGEIWAFGLRNPFRFSFDRANGNVWIGDVGQSSREEIDFQPALGNAGRNYGWPAVEGTLCNTCSNSCGMVNCMNPSFIPPVHEYDPNVGRAIIGGYVYRGSAMPSFRGCYVFGDNSSGQIWAINPASPSVRVLLKSLAGVSTFGEDSNGELYVGTLSGTVFRLGPSTPVASVPASGAWAGIGLAALLATFGLVRRRRALV